MRVLFVPAVRRGMGTGHLRRTAELARRLGPQAGLLLEGCREEFGLGPRELLDSLGLDSRELEARGVGCLEKYRQADPQPVHSGETGARPEGRPWDLVVLDRRATTRAELGRYAGIAVVGLDEGGEARRYAAYVIDLLPTPPGFPAPNQVCPGLLLPGDPDAAGAPAQRGGEPQGSAPAQGSPQGPTRGSPQAGGILLSFGGEDPADLSSRMLAVLIRRLGVPAARLTVVQGALFRTTAWPAGVRVLHSPQRLAGLLGGYDLVFTSFGLTSFEALAAGVPVVNFNPSRYHRRLSRAAGIPEVGVRRPRAGALRRVLRNPGASTLRRGGPPESLRPVEDPAAFFAALRPDAGRGCPVCRSEGNPAVARFPRRSYFECRVCGVTYLVGFGLPQRRYDREYFGEEYRRQYGRTYLEDFDGIKAAGRRRVAVLRRLLGSPGGRLLDVGCAYGPFLAAAREAGYRGEGLDVSQDAVEHVHAALGMPCRRGDFEAQDGEPWGAGSFDVLSMWYVIEHFRDPARALARAAGLLRPGGVLAFSTPNGAGVSGRRDREAFLRSAPEDHRTVWTPRTARRVLRRFGFRPALTVITGHHPERFPWPGGIPIESASPLRRSLLGLLALASRTLGLGDTFEVYALRVGERGRRR